METKERRTRLAAWRAGAGWTLDEASGVAGISAPTWSRVERGLLNLAPATKVKVARRLGVSVRDLFEVEEIAP